MHLTENKKSNEFFIFLEYNLNIFLKIQLKQSFNLNEIKLNRFL